MKAIHLFMVFLLVLELCVAKKDVNFLRLVNCPEYKNYTVVLQNVVFTRNNKGKAVSVRFGVLFKKAVKRLMVLVTIKKCDNSGNLDSCEYFMNDFKINNVCDIMGQKNQIWTQVLSNSNFPKSCPISPGKYYLNDTKLDNDMHLSLIPIPIALWKIRFLTYDSGSENAMVTCADLELKVFDARKEANFVRFTNCPEYKNYTALYKNVVLGKNKNGRTVSIKLNLIIKKEIKRAMVLVTMKKCDNSESLDSCEYYIQDFKVKNVCDIMGKQGQVWSAALSNSNLPSSCPISAGKYILNDTKLDSDLQLTLLPVPIALWKMRFKTYDSGNDNVMVSCCDLDVKVYSVRRNS